MLLRLDLLVSDRAPLLPELLTARNHPPYLTRHRLDAIVDRVRLVAAAFSGLTLMWIALDAATLPGPTWQFLAALRVLAALIFAVLSLMPRRPATLWGARFRLAVLLLNPLMLSVAAQAMFSGLDLAGPALINARLYQSLPFVVIAGLGIFPLVATEGLGFAAPVLALGGLAPVLFGRAGDWVQSFTTLWLLGLILGVYLLAGMIQLSYMIALLRRASIDPLTGAFTRRSGHEIIELQFRMACSQNIPFTVMFIDLDDFKGVNDRFGHEAGDTVLAKAAQTLTEYLRRGDVVIRWGGEEFLALLPAPWSRPAPPSKASRKTAARKTCPSLNKVPS